MSWWGFGAAIHVTHRAGGIPQLSPLGARQGGPCYLIKPINEWAKKAANTA
jgi:hypothetical protein